MEDRRSTLFAAVGAVGLVLGIVALVIAIGAKNDTQSESELSASVQQELDEKATSLKKELAAQASRTGSVAKQVNKALKRGEGAEKAASADRSETAKLKAELEKLTATTDRLTNDVAALQNDQTATKKQLEELTKTVNSLVKSSKGDG